MRLPSKSLANQKFLVVVKPPPSHDRLVQPPVPRAKEGANRFRGHAELLRKLLGRQPRVVIVHAVRVAIGDDSRHGGVRVRQRAPVRNSDMDYPSTLLSLAAASVAYIVVGVAAALLLLYGVIRVAVARGMRDHHKWLEKNRAAPSDSRAG